jgi:NADPH-dependent glutamate synthase beta subunit-like oxidoreductase
VVEGRTHKPVVTAGLCETCNVCVQGCPAEVIAEYRKEATSVRGALYGGVAPRREAENGLLPPCQKACPINLETRDYVRLIAEGKYLDAIDVIREDLPFPGIIGRICHHPCEGACLRGQKLDEPVSLCALKRFVADYEAGKREIPVPAVGPEKNRRVAVIGGGPSGMTCALDLRRAGYAVTVFESHDRLGGMLFFGVPAYRLPRDVLEREVSLVRKAGIELKLNMRVGKDIALKEIREAFDAIYIGCGAERGARLGIENEESPGVMGGVEFLALVNRGDSARVGKKVIVVGGGNVAVDVALAAKRLGASEVRMVCIEKQSEMPAGEWEKGEVREEGIKISPSWGPKRIIMENGKVTGVECRKCTSVFDKEGRFRPAYNEQVTMIFDGETIIVAIGQAPEMDFLKGFEGLELDVEGWIKTDSETLETSIHGIFAGGDIVRGPRMAIDAVADGKKAALSIDRYLS